MEGLYRDPVSVNDTLVSDTTNMGNLPLGRYSRTPITEINSSGTGTNSDLQTAILKVKEAED